MAKKQKKWRPIDERIIRLEDYVKRTRMRATKALERADVLQDRLNALLEKRQNENLQPA